MKTICILSLFVILFQGCETFAPVSPLVTFGGPKTTEKSRSEVGFGLGSGGVLFPEAHATGHGYFARYKYGITNNFDFGIDAIGIQHGDKGCFSGKTVGRYNFCDNFRFEAGIGVADDNSGKSLNGDIGLTWGTLSGKKWNFYSTARLGAAKGYPGNISGSGEETPHDALIPILNIGVQGDVSPVSRFIFEFGYGYVLTRGHDAGTILYISCGQLHKI